MSPGLTVARRIRLPATHARFPLLPKCMNSGSFARGAKIWRGPCKPHFHSAALEARCTSLGRPTSEGEKRMAARFQQNAGIEFAPLQDEVILFHAPSNKFCVLNRTS